MAKHDWVPSDDEVNKAKGVLERAYRSWVNDLVEELIFDSFNENIDESEFQDRVSERTDSGLIYTADQHTVLSASRNTGEALDEMRGMYDQIPENLEAVWAVLTYQQDVNEALQGLALLEPLRNGDNLEERINWLIEEHGGQDYDISRGGEEVHLWLIGEIDDVSFGALVVTNDNHEFIARGLDMSSLKVMMDMILDNGGDYEAENVRKFIRHASGVR